MCTRQALLHWRHIKVFRGDLKMSVFVWCMLILLLCPISKEMVVIKTRPDSSPFLRWRSYRMEKAQNFIQTLKRHAEGTFTSDFTHYLDKIKAKDFVEWLASKKERCEEHLHHIAPEV